MKANDIKRGTVFKVDGKNIITKHVQVQSPSSRSGSTLYKVKGQDVSSGQKYENSFKGDENVEQVEITRSPVQLLYRDGDGCTFMDSETFDQYTVADDIIEEDLPFLSEGLEGIKALTSDGVLLGLELPSTITLEITECAPSMKGASAQARNKPATVSTGLIVQVPEYLAEGEVIKINTETREYMSRA
jgi:elongation factor P